jgi:hypothetical protein
VAGGAGATADVGAAVVVGDVVVDGVTAAGTYAAGGGGEELVVARVAAPESAAAAGVAVPAVEVAHAVNPKTGMTASMVTTRPRVILMLPPGRSGDHTECVLATRKCRLSEE